MTVRTKSIGHPMEACFRHIEKKNKEWIKSHYSKIASWYCKIVCHYCGIVSHYFQMDLIIKNYFQCGER